MQIRNVPYEYFVSPIECEVWIMVLLKGHNYPVYDLHYVMFIIFIITRYSPLDHIHGRQCLG